jgi:two-component system, NarL family, response regulator DegU
LYNLFLLNDANEKNNSTQYQKNMLTKYTAIIADDHPIFRTGVKEIVNSIGNIELLGESSTGIDAYQLILATMPNIAILDLEMPTLTGLDVCKKVLSEKNNTKFIILTMHKEKHYFRQAMECGVMGYLLKDYAQTDLVDCINSVMENKKYVSPKIQDYLIEYDSAGEQSEESIAINKLLTPTEKVILKLIADGNTSQQIGKLLFISPFTVDNHRSNISKKLNLEGKNSLMKFVLQHKGEF